MLRKNQEQAASEGSTAIQAGGNVIVTTTGLAYADVRAVALDVFRANFHQLAGEAKEIARDRAERITDEFLSKMQDEHPAGLDKAQDPDFQYALFTVQKEYARNGDKDLGDLLVDLLVDRSKHKQRDILQIVLNESLGTAPKLTDNQLAVLALVFVLRYAQHNSIGNYQKLGEFLDKYVSPFASKVVANQACYQHLEFSGCGSISIGSQSIELIFQRNYQGLFLKGFDQIEVSNRKIPLEVASKFVIPCLNDPSKMQIRALNERSLAETLEADAVSADDRVSLSELFGVGLMGHDEIKEKIISVRPYTAGLFENWSGSPMKNFTLTSVGIAIGHANIKRLVGEFADLSIWIN